jgi:hypothetical protein
MVFAFLCRQKYQELYRLESRKDKRKLKKRHKVQRKKSRSGPDSAAKKPKKIYTTDPHQYHRQQSSNTMPSHRFSIPSIRVEAPPPPPSATEHLTKTTSDLKNHSGGTTYLNRHHQGNNDSDEEAESAADSDEDDEHEEEKKEKTTKTIDSKSSHFQETFARFRQSYLSRPKVSHLIFQSSLLVIFFYFCETINLNLLYFTCCLIHRFCGMRMRNVLRWLRP